VTLQAKKNKNKAIWAVFTVFLKTVYLFNLHIIVSLVHIKKQFLISLLWYIHANDYEQFSAVPYIINCLSRWSKCII